jgi:hypothetical protein
VDHLYNRRTGAGLLASGKRQRQAASAEPGQFSPQVSKALDAVSITLWYATRVRPFPACQHSTHLKLQDDPQFREMLSCLSVSAIPSQGLMVVVAPSLIDGYHP